MCNVLILTTVEQSIPQSESMLFAPSSPTRTQVQIESVSWSCYRNYNVDPQIRLVILLTERDKMLIHTDASDLHKDYMFI